MDAVLAGARQAERVSEGVRGPAQESSDRRRGARFVLGEVVGAERFERSTS